MYPIKLLLLLLSIAVISCGKAIPDETMDGRGTFYCKVNGEDYFPDCNSFACQDVRAIYSTFGDAVNVRALKDNVDEALDIRLYIYNVSSLPSLIKKNDPDQYLDNTAIFQGCGSLFLELEKDFILNITKIDLENGIISGTFSGNFYRKDVNYNCSIDSIKLTEGVFDLPISF